MPVRYVLTVMRLQTVGSPPRVSTVGNTRADLQRRWAEHCKKMAALDAKIVRLDGTMRGMAATGAVRSALIKCGVNPRALGVAEAYLAKQLKIEVDDSGVATVSGAYGRQSVESAVARWLASEDGAAFAPKQPTVLGPISEALKLLRSH